MLRRVSHPPASVCNLVCRLSLGLGLGPRLEVLLRCSMRRRNAVHGAALELTALVPGVFSRVSDGRGRLASLDHRQVQPTGRAELLLLRGPR